MLLKLIVSSFLVLTFTSSSNAVFDEVSKGFKEKFLQLENILMTEYLKNDNQYEAFVDYLDQRYTNLNNIFQLIRTVPGNPRRFLGSENDKNILKSVLDLTKDTVANLRYYNTDPQTAIRYIDDYFYKFSQFVMNGSQRAKNELFRDTQSPFYKENVAVVDWLDTLVKFVGAVRERLYNRDLNNAILIYFTNAFRNNNKLIKFFDGEQYEWLYGRYLWNYNNNNLMPKV